MRGSGHGVRLSPRERDILSALADAIIPPGGTPSASGADVGAGLITARLVEQRMARPIGWILRLALWSFELRAIIPHLAPFSRLPATTRRRIVEEAVHDRLPLRPRLLELFRHVLINPYLSDPGVGRQIGYDRDAWLSGCADREGLPVFDPSTPPTLEPVTNPNIPTQMSVDAVVVGSGAGGAPVAALLAEAGLDVLVLEEGAYHGEQQFRDEPVWDRFVDLYRDLGLTGTVGRPPIPVPLGKAVGGTTVVNAGTTFRAPARILDGWVRDLGLDGADATTMKPVFDEVEEVQGITTPPDECLGNNAQVFARGLERLDGHPGQALPRNLRDCRGCGESVVGCPFGAKQAVHLTWLPRAERAGATIFARVRVDRVRHQSGRVQGIAATILDSGRQDVPRGSLTVDAPVVVVAAGAFHTPLLLSRSQVDDPSRMRGRNLQLHPAIGVTAEMNEDVHGWRGVLQSWGSETLMESLGINIEATAAPPPLTGGQMPFVGRTLKELIPTAPRLATVGFLIEDSTAGRVFPLPGNRFLATYSLTDDDARRISAGYAFVGEALLEAGARRILVGSRWASTRSELHRIRDDGLPPAALKLSAYHPVGTHRMAGSAQDGPADPWGAVWGIEGLWVSDASLLPTCLGVNPQETIMAFAVRTARRIVETG